MDDARLVQSDEDRNVANIAARRVAGLHQVADCLANVIAKNQYSLNRIGGWGTINGAKDDITFIFSTLSEEDTAVFLRGGIAALLDQIAPKVDAVAVDAVAADADVKAG